MKCGNCVYSQCTGNKECETCVGSNFTSNRDIEVIEDINAMARGERLRLVAEYSNAPTFEKKEELYVKVMRISCVIKDVERILQEIEEGK